MLPHRRGKKTKKRHPRVVEQHISDEECAARIVQAIIMGSWCGYAAEVLCPVVWTGSAAHVYHPPEDGLYKLAWFQWSYAPHRTFPHDDALTLLAPRWDQHLHMGHVPARPSVSDAKPLDHTVYFDFSIFAVTLRDPEDMVEVTPCTANPAGCGTEATDAQAMPGDSPSEATSATHKASPEVHKPKAMPCKSAKPIKVNEWLINSGTPLDLVDKAAVKRYTHLVESCEPALLDTADGEVVADALIHLHNSTLGENISPYVLESTPNVLSLGRRVVVDGYSWHWEGYTTQPVMIHPGTGQHIALEVHDFCPYLRDAGDTFPLALCPEASSHARRSVAPALQHLAAVARPCPAVPAGSSSEPFVPDVSSDGGGVGDGGGDVAAMPL